MTRKIAISAAVVFGLLGCQSTPPSAPPQGGVAAAPEKMGQQNAGPIAPHRVTILPLKHN